MANYLASGGDSIVFEPADGPPLDPLRATMSYFTELRGLRIAFVELVADAEDHAVNGLKSGRVGRLTIRHRNDADEAVTRSIPLGVLTCISHASVVGNAIRKTLVFTEITPPEAR